MLEDGWPPLWSIPAPDPFPGHPEILGLAETVLGKLWLSAPPNIRSGKVRDFFQTRMAERFSSPLVDARLPGAKMPSDNMGSGTGSSPTPLPKAFISVKDVIAGDQEGIDGLV